MAWSYSESDQLCISLCHLTKYDVLKAVLKRYIHMRMLIIGVFFVLSQKSENQFAECRVRFLSFMGIAANNIRFVLFISLNYITDII